jgi:hypothetical protein
MVILSISHKFAGKMSIHKAGTATLVEIVLHTSCIFASQLPNLNLHILTDPITATVELRGHHCGAGHPQELPSATLVASI